MKNSKHLQAVKANQIWHISLLSKSAPTICKHWIHLLFVFRRNWSAGWIWKRGVLIPPTALHWILGPSVVIMFGIIILLILRNFFSCCESVDNFKLIIYTKLLYHILKALWRHGAVLLQISYKLVQKPLPFIWWKNVYLKKHEGVM